MIYESAKSRGLRGNVGYVGWVAQIFTWVAWVTWIKIFFTWVVWVNFFAWVAWFQNFCVSQIFYFVFAWVSFYLLDDIILLYCNYSLDIFFVSLFPANLDQHCLTSLVFLSGLLEIYKKDGIQWHFYERVTKFYLRAANWPYSQRGCEYSQTPLPIYGNFFSEKNFLKNVVSCPK